MLTKLNTIQETLVVHEVKIGGIETGVIRLKELLGEAGLETEDQFEGVFPLESVEALSTLDQELEGNPGYRQKAVSNIQKT